MLLEDRVAELGKRVAELERKAPKEKKMAIASNILSIVLTTALVINILSQLVYLYLR